MPSRTQDYYALLGVEKTASAEEIKKAFRHKARELHPDVNSASDAEDRFKEVNEAYDVLSDPDKRDQYDRYGRVGGPGAAPGGYQYADFGDLFGGGGGLNMEDLFSAFFGGVRGRGTRLEGRDMAMQLVITLAEAATGVVKEVVLDRLASCDVCGGSGSSDGSGVTNCPDCGGTGQRVVQRKTFLGTMQTSRAVRELRSDRPCGSQSVRGVPGVGARARPAARQGERACGHQGRSADSAARSRRGGHPRCGSG